MKPYNPDERNIALRKRARAPIQQSCFRTCDDRSRARYLFELALVALTIPLLAVVTMQVLVAFVAPLCAIVGFPFGWWAVRKAQSGFVLHGALVGIVATLIYFGLIIGQAGSVRPAIEVYGPFWFFLANAAKILGCVAGAFACGRRRKRDASSPITEQASPAIRP